MNNFYYCGLTSHRWGSTGSAGDSIPVLCANDVFLLGIEEKMIEVFLHYGDNQTHLRGHFPLTFHIGYIFTGQSADSPELVQC